MTLTLQNREMNFLTQVGTVVTTNQSQQAGNLADPPNSSDAAWRTMVSGYLQQLWSKVFCGPFGDNLGVDTDVTGYHARTFTNLVELVSLDLTVGASWGGGSYGALEYANYGVIAFSQAGKLFPVKWINFGQSVFLADHPRCDGWALFLKPDVSATVFTDGRTGASDVLWGGGGSPADTIFNPYTNQHAHMG